MVFWCSQSHGKTAFYPFPESSSICCWDLGSACLSQRKWKLAGEEGLACANYILIIGNVLANQASIAILEHIGPLCRLRTEACSVRGWKCGWDQTQSEMHGLPSQLDMAACLVSMLGTDRAAITHGDARRRSGALWQTYSPILPYGEEQRDPLHSTHFGPRKYTKETCQHEKKWKEFHGFLRRNMCDSQLVLTCACARQGAQTLFSRELNLILLPHKLHPHHTAVHSWGGRKNIRIRFCASNHLTLHTWWHTINFDCLQWPRGSLPITSSFY